MISFHTGDSKLIFHYIANPNIGGDIPVDVPTNQNIGGDTSPASPAGLTSMDPRLVGVASVGIFAGITLATSTGRRGSASRVFMNEVDNNRRLVTSARDGI